MSRTVPDLLADMVPATIFGTWMGVPFLVVDYDVK
jgi:hypothetical protein